MGNVFFLVLQSGIILFIQSMKRDPVILHLLDNYDFDSEILLYFAIPRTEIAMLISYLYCYLANHSITCTFLGRCNN